jgi:hypothetical protein
MPKSLHFFYRLEQIDYLISSKRTGKPRELAKRVGLSERALYDFIILMKELGAPIAYCKQTQTYFYKERGNFNIKFKKAS